MKKLIAIIFILIIVLLLVYQDDKEAKTTTNEIRGVYISYIDYESKLKDKGKEEQEASIKEMVNNINDIGLNTIYLQVRPFADAIYKSSIFPISDCISSTNTLNLDILSYFIELSHQKNIKVHAWINPYRISSSNIIKENAIYSTWTNTNNIEVTDNGTYFNPASNDVLNLILDGVSELVINYDIDGIIYDDYFYPNKTIDLNSYASYKSNTNNQITIEEFRIDVIKKLIKSTYQKIKEIDKNVSFGIAPAGNIENNLNEEYLDIATILKEEKYLDYVSPQLYYGFNNQSKPFIQTLNTWNDLIKQDIELIPSLALYKSGLTDKYAGEGSEEWIYNTDIIKKQIMSSRVVSNYKGFIIYRYDFLFNNNKMNENTIKEVENIKEILTK